MWCVKGVYMVRDNRCMHVHLFVVRCVYVRLLRCVGIYAVVRGTVG